MATHNLENPLKILSLVVKIYGVNITVAKIKWIRLPSITSDNFDIKIDLLNYIRLFYVILLFLVFVFLIHIDHIDLNLWGIPHLFGMASCQVGNFVHLFPPSSVLCRLSFVIGV